MAKKSPDSKWWSHTDPAGTISDVVMRLGQSQTRRRDMNVHHLRLYADRDLYGAGGVALGKAANPRLGAWNAVAASRRPKLSINVIANMADAATSMLVRSRPRPTFMTNGGDWATWQRSQKQSQFLEAVYNAENTHILAGRMAQHGIVLGTGAIKVVRDYANKRPRHELAYVGELMIDEAEAVYGQPRSLFQIRAIDKLVLKEIYGGEGGEKGAEQAIDQAKSAQSWPKRAEVSDCVVVVEAWHLPSAPGAKDGAYIVCTDAGVLHREDYPHENFPFVFWRWKEDPLGFFGTGIPAELVGIQYEINETIRNIQANWWSGGNLKILVERGSKINKAHLNNDLRAAVVEYTGNPPAWVTTEAVAPGLVQYLEFLIEQAYNVTGISQLTAQSQTPFASMSGKARLVHENSESLRFLPAQRRLEQAIGVDLGYRTLEACEDIYSDIGDFEVLYRDRKFLRPMMYKDIRAEKGTYEIQCYPTSILPSTPAGKYTMIEAWMTSGLISPDVAKRLMDIPDLKREIDVDIAPDEFVDEQLSRIVQGETVSTEGPVFPPEPDQPIAAIIGRTEKWISWARTNGAPDEILEQLRTYRDGALAIQQDQAQKAAPAPMPAAMPRPGAPLPQLTPGQA